MGERHEQFRQMKRDLAEINTSRGGGAEKGLKGFYAEYVNSTYGNLDRMESGVAAREIVINDNGDWDAVVKYATGASGRPIQDKVGYTFSYYKSKIASNQYDDGILRINPDNPIFSDDQKWSELNSFAKEHGIKIIKGSVTENEAKTLAIVAGEEGKIRSVFGLENNAPVTAELYADSKEVKYVVDNMQKKVIEVNEYIHTTTNNFLSENAARINEAGLNQAESAACFAAAMSIGRNTVALLKGEEEFSQATKDVIADVTATAVMGYATGAVSEVIGVATGDASILINGTIQLSKQLITYLEDDIDEQELVENIAEIGAHLAIAYIGRIVGGSIGSIGGPIGIVAGQFVGEMISTAVCADIISTIKASKEFEKQNDKIIALYKNAEFEIRASQARLESLIQKENDELEKAIASGMDQIVFGIINDSYNDIELGLADISEKFGLNLEQLQKDKITRNNLFDAETIVLN